MVIQPRNKARTDLLRLFDQGHTPATLLRPPKKGESAQNTSLIQNLAKNTVYRWYKIWVLAQIKKELDLRMMTQDFKPLSQRDCDKVLKWARSGQFD